MGKKNYIPDHLKDKEYFAGKAGSFSGVPLRTVQTWTERGLVIPGKSGTTGTGDKRIYNSLNCIEIAIIKYLADRRLKLESIKAIMGWLREPGEEIAAQILRLFRRGPLPDETLREKSDEVGLWSSDFSAEYTILEALLLQDPGCLIIRETGDNKLLFTVAKELMEKVGLSGDWVWNYFTNPKSMYPKRKPYDTKNDSESVMIINLTKIADKVLKKMS